MNVNFQLSESLERFMTKFIKASAKTIKEKLTSLNWSHTLNAIYRVSCNLFHCEKVAHSEMDQRIVSPAFKIMFLILENQGTGNRK